MRLLDHITRPKIGQRITVHACIGTRDTLIGAPTPSSLVFVDIFRFVLTWIDHG